MEESLSSSNDSLHLAAERGDEEEIVTLLKQRRDLDAVDMKGWTALYHACVNGSFSIAKLLLDHGASPNSAVIGTGETLLHVAALSNFEDIVALLLSNKADVNAVNKDGYTVLMYAAYTLSENMLKRLLSYGADISAVAPNGHTALSLACMFAWSGDVANLLIRSGADVHWVGTGQFSKGYTLVHHAAQRDRIEIIQMLLDMKVDVDAVTEDGRTALHMACELRFRNAVECLLQNGAQVSYPCRNGRTALHFAVQGYRSEDPEYPHVVELLFKYGADVNAEDEERRTPLDLALQMSRTELVKVFVKQLMNLKAQGLFVSEKNLKAISENEEANSFSSSCEEEIKRMRQSAIGDSSVKIYDIFTKRTNRLADFVSNENVERSLESENYKAEFPIYAGAIRLKFLQGKERRDLLRQSSDWLWTVISEFCELPFVLVQRINRYLMNTDLALQISHEPSQQKSVCAQL